MPSRPLTEHAYVAAIRMTDPVRRTGVVTRIMPTFVEADGPGAPLGSLCAIGGEQSEPTLAEIVNVERTRVTLAPYSTASAIRIGDEVAALQADATIPVGDAYLGRVVDPLGRPLDGAGALGHCVANWPLAGIATPPLERQSPEHVLETGVRALDALLTLGVGQRVGLFAGSGVGKTTLLGALARDVYADVRVLCLVGERGREVEECWNRTLSAASRARTTLVVATSDQSAALRARSVPAALSIAEYFRSQGAHVLLMIDSVTRYALALREIGLAAGEPPTVRAYTPGVFAALPKIVERCGALKSGGAITALMTVLTESDDIDDPMAETMRSLLDGHIVLSRALAEQGQFPPIQVPKSVSRVSRYVANDAERALAADAIAQLALYDASKTLVESGLYTAGSHPALDRALRLRPALLSFLRQDAESPTGREQAIAMLASLLEDPA
ncbi:FliI/YscN family ATPase [Burkholderia ambifaria]|uniref:ATPase, FliI/YscN family n=1 Tax=Burkholderia ambifaria MEX-5 TaxID=396597 RepID=B1TCL2_9BURK|nr:FliI/YscN family ATPase [Burkholderia ambifaria]EDT38684.1 ATPase, FliI/YscN family [Burkholderia ambifaria MEX-5]